MHISWSSIRRLTRLVAHSAHMPCSFQRKIKLDALMTLRQTMLHADTTLQLWMSEKKLRPGALRPLHSIPCHWLSAFVLVSSSIAHIPQLCHSSCLEIQPLTKRLKLIVSLSSADKGFWMPVSRYQYVPSPMLRYLFTNWGWFFPSSHHLSPEDKHISAHWLVLLDTLRREQTDLSPFRTRDLSLHRAEASP